MTRTAPPRCRVSDRRARRGRAIGSVCPVPVLDLIHACEIADLGADGVFLFEGQHDVFFPLVVAAAETPLAAVTLFDVGTDLRPQPQTEAALAEDLQIVGRVCQMQRAAWPGDRHVGHHYGPPFHLGPQGSTMEVYGATKAALTASQAA
jgi:hypothetical protein